MTSATVAHWRRRWPRWPRTGDDGEHGDLLEEHYAALGSVGARLGAMPGLSRTFLAARRGSAMCTGWRAWRVPGGYHSRSFRRPIFVTCALVSRQRVRFREESSAQTLADVGVRLHFLGSDIHGPVRRARVKARIAGKLVSAVFDCTGLEAVPPETLGDTHRFVLGEVMTHIESLEATMARFDTQWLAHLEPGPSQWNLLHTRPGVGLMGATMRLGRLARRATSKAPNAWHSRGNLPWPRRIRRPTPERPNPQRKRLGRRWLCEFAQAAAHSRCDFRDKFASLALRKGHKKSLTALAHKRLRLLFAMLANNNSVPRS